MDKNKLPLQLVLMTIVVTIAGFLGMSMPIVALTFPIILTYIGLKEGISKSVITFVASLVIIGVITQDLSTLAIPFQYGILSIFTSYMINKKYKINKIVLYSASLIFIMVLIHMGLRWYFTGINTFVELEKTLVEISNQQIATLKTGDMKESEISQLSNTLRETTKYIASVFPVLLMISSLFISYINYYISSRLARSSGRVDIDVPEFSKIIFPKHVVTGFGLVLLASYALKYVGEFNYNQLLDNIFILIYLVFLIEGLSLTVFLINKMKMGKFFKTLFIFLIVASSFLNIVLFSIGVMDIILDFRKIRKIDVTE